MALLLHYDNINIISMELRDIDTADIEIYNIIFVEKVYNTAFFALWVLFSQLL